jgi:flavin-binding protein dodecin
VTEPPVARVHNHVSAGPDLRIDKQALDVAHWQVSMKVNFALDE